MPEPAVPTTPPDPRARVLLVDDEPANLLALEAVLDDLGLRPGPGRVRRGGPAPGRRPDFAVVLLDVRHARHGRVRDGPPIRAGSGRGTTPIIFLTAHEADEFPVVEAYKLGAVDYLVKPLVPDDPPGQGGRLRRAVQRQKERAWRQAEHAPPAGPGDQGLRHLHARPATAGSPPGTPGPSASRATGPTRSSASTSPPSTPGRPSIGAGRPRSCGGRSPTAGSRTRAGGSARTAPRFWANVVITALRDEAGRPARVLQGHPRPDRAEAVGGDLRRLHEELEQRVRDRTADLAAGQRGPPGGRPPQGRVPGHARPRAAQPAGPHPAPALQVLAPAPGRPVGYRHGPGR